MIPLGEYDIILGVDWMKQLNLMIFGFIKATITFNCRDLLIELNGNGLYKNSITETKDMTTRKLARQNNAIESRTIFLVMRIEKDIQIPEFSNKKTRNIT